MTIEKTERDRALEDLVDGELARYEKKCGVASNYARFAFAAREGGEIIGAATGFTCYAEVYVDELVVHEGRRGEGVGRLLLKAVEEHFSGQGFDNINLCTNGFQAPRFYEKCGFSLEFVRKNRAEPRLDKYFFVKYF